MAKQALKFGEFTLKSGRKSPYFFNIGSFDDGLSLRIAGEAYADCIEENGFEYDVLFGPAYKGIPLAVATVMALNAHAHEVNMPYAFNRKEVKDHGEGGQLVGADIAGKRVLVIDDVITAGTAFRQAHAMITSAGGQVVGLVTALNREERAQSELPAMEELSQMFQMPVASITSLSNIIDMVRDDTDLSENLPKLLMHREQYGQG